MASFPTPIDASAFEVYCREVSISREDISEFTNAEKPNVLRRWLSVQCDGRTVAVGAMVLPEKSDAVARMVVHVRQEQTRRGLFADYLLETLVRTACESAAITVELIHLNGQSIVNRLAAGVGFYRYGNARSFFKIAVGRPLTAHNWSAVAQQVRRRTD